MRGNALGKRPARSMGLPVLLAAIVLGAATGSRWLPLVKNRISAASREFGRTTTSTESAGEPGPHPQADHEHHGADIHTGGAHSHAHSGHDHEGHDHGHDHAQDHGGLSHSDHESNALTLSAVALRNVGLIKEQIRRVELTTFWRSITVPAQVVGRTGRTQVQVATPMTGMITHVHAQRGQAVAPGTLLFRIQLTHEDLLKLQTEFLQTIGELDVEEREIERLSDVTLSQAVPRRLLLEREYERDKLTALRKAQRESLRLHGLTIEQITTIVRDRRLIRELDVFAPTVDRHPASEQSHVPAEYLPDDSPESHHSVNSENPLVLEQLNVHKGQIVAAGTTLCVLKDYSELYIEGRALEQDVPVLRRALQEKSEVTAVFAESGAKSGVMRKLQIEHLANAVDSESRSVRFFVKLPNTVSNEHRHDNVRFVEWTWMIGQRVQLRVPFGHWKKQIVLPLEAVVEEGSGNYVFRRHDEHFDRVAIRVKHRDALFVVVERDGAISPGDQIAWQGAHQMQTALRTKSSGPVDAHHGHTH